MMKKYISYTLFYSVLYMFLRWVLSSIQNAHWVVGDTGSVPV